METTRGVGIGYDAFRDELNVGLVYHGTDLRGHVGQRIDVAGNQLQWDARAALGLMWSRGMTAIELDAEPVSAGYLLRIVDGRTTVWVGPGLSANYRWYVNPDLQSGSFFWYTHYDLQARATASVAFKAERFRFDLRIGALSLASRPVARPDPYFYTFNFSELVSRAHGDMVVGTLGRTNHVSLVAEWFVPGTEMTLGYEFAYAGYTPAPALDTLQHVARISWY